MWWVIIIVAVVVWLNYKKDRESKQKGRESIQKDIKQEDEGAMQNESEKDRIYAEVEKRRERAKKLGVPELITKEYHDHIKYYPSWIKDNKNRESVYPLITDAVKLKPEKSDEEDDGKERIKITLNGKNYIFSYKEHSFTLPDDEWCNTGDLELYQENKKVLSLSISIEYEKIVGSIFHPSEIKAFIEGDWINDFKDLAKWEEEKEIKFMEELQHPPMR